jgi:transcriptional regulator with XRE-family HTH domain
MELEVVEPQAALGSLLRSLRQRIPSTATAVGPFDRLPSRRGRRVTQEEMAEIVGVSRGWYRSLESGATVRPSVQLLDRLADTLSLPFEERTQLFALAIPEINRAQIQTDASTMLEAFSWVRSLTKRLWAANSEAEAYREVCERLIARFGDAELVHWMRRNDLGVWERNCFVSRGQMDVEGIGRELHARLKPGGVDKLMLYPQLREPGALGGIEHLPPRVQQTRLAVYARRGLVAPDFIHARVCSRQGVVGGFSVFHPKGRSYSATECTLLGGLAELTSLAIS